jgi:hypothetical protein
MDVTCDAQIKSMRFKCARKYSEMHLLRIFKPLEAHMRVNFNLSARRHQIVVTTHRSETDPS